MMNVDKNKKMTFIGFKNVATTDKELLGMADNLNDSRFRNIPEKVTTEVVLLPPSVNIFLSMIQQSASADVFQKNLKVVTQENKSGGVPTWYMNFNELIEFLKVSETNDTAAYLLNSMADWTELGVNDVYFDGSLLKH
jgi:hypothetical protein